MLWSEFDNNVFVNPSAGLSTLIYPLEFPAGSPFGIDSIESSHDTVLRDSTQSTGPLSEFTSRLPSLEPEEGNSSNPNPHENVPQDPSQARNAPQIAARPWIIMPKTYTIIRESLEQYSHLFPEELIFPSRHSMCRYVEGYFSGFHAHLPFLHVPTISMLKASPELTMSILAVGATYRFQRRQSRYLYLAARALVEHRLRRHDTQTTPASTSGYFPALSGLAGLSSQPCPLDNPRCPSSCLHRMKARHIEVMQAMILLMALGTWNHQSLLGDSFSLASQLALLAQEDQPSMDLEKDSQQPAWARWLHDESERRTKFTAYCFMNLHSIVYNIAPKIMNKQVGGLPLPAPESHWTATNEEEWLAAKQEDEALEVTFQDAYSQLFSPGATSLSSATSFGNYVLIHGLIQQIFFCRQSLIDFDTYPEPSIPAETAQRLQSALRKWQKTWDNTKGASLEPVSPHGPLGFNSTALFRIALIRLHVDLGPRRQLETRDPHRLARSLYDSPPIPRSASVCKTVLQTAHALSILVRIGVEFVSKTQTFSWSIVHVLCNLECACFLSKWLQSISTVISKGEALSQDEKRLFQIIVCILIEADTGAGTEDRHAIYKDGLNSSSSINLVGAAVVRLWAEAFKGVNVFDIVKPISDGLCFYALMLEDASSANKASEPELAQARNHEMTQTVGHTSTLPGDQLEDLQ